MTPLRSCLEADHTKNPSHFNLKAPAFGLHYIPHHTIPGGQTSRAPLAGRPKRQTIMTKQLAKLSKTQSRLPVRCKHRHTPPQRQYVSATVPQKQYPSPAHLEGPTKPGIDHGGSIPQKAVQSGNYWMYLGVAVSSPPYTTTT